MKTKILIMICLLFALGYYEKVKAPEVPLDTKTSPTGHLDALINQLAYCESSNNPNAVHHLDGVDGKTSFGLLQFKKATMLHYWKKLINKDIEDQEIDNLWHDPQAQIQLAKAMITDNPDNLRHWENCSRKLELRSYVKYVPIEPKSI